MAASNRLFPGLICPVGHWIICAGALFQTGQGILIGSPEGEPVPDYTVNRARKKCLPSGKTDRPDLIAVENEIPAANADAGRIENNNTTGE